jgi:hypothetical protein
MPLLDESLLGALLRGLGRLFFEIVVELLLEGVGEWLYHRIRPRREPASWVSVVIGLLFWVVVIAIVVAVWTG